MKTHRILFRAVDRNKFVEIKQGMKTIETRAATPKYQAIRPGDSLNFMCELDSFTRQVIAVEHYDSLDAMFAMLPLEKIFPSNPTVEAITAAYNSFPGYTEKLAEYGIMAFELEQ